MNSSVRRLLQTLTFLLVIAPFMANAGTVDLGRTVPEGFILNAGQWPAEVLGVARQSGSEVWITRTGVVLDQYSISKDDQQRNGVVTREGFREMQSRFELRTGTVVGHVTFARGSDRSRWVSAPVVSNLWLVDCYPNVTFEYSRSQDGRVRREILAAPGADLAAIKLDVLGGGKNEVADVSVTTSTVYGTFIGGPSDDELAGVEYLSNGTIVVAGNTAELSAPGVTGGYSSSMKGRIDGFLARFDSRLEKMLSYTYIGGSAEDRIRGLTKDRLNNVYVTGETISTDFPTTSGVTGKLYKALNDAFVAKFDSTLTKLIVSFYHGGNKDDVARAIKVDQDFNIYIAGSTNSTTNFPVTFPATVKITIPGGWGRPPTYRDIPGGGANQGQIDGFVASFSQNGSMLLSRFFGGTGNDVFTALALDKSSSVYMTGYTTSSNFETAPTSDRFASGRKPADESFNGGITDAFVVKLSRELTLASTDDGTYSTYFGGDNDEEGHDIVVDDLGRAYIVGWTTSNNLPAVGTLNTQRIGQKDVFLAFFADDGRELAGTTYYGGTGDDAAYAVELISGTTVMMAGTTNSENFPLTGEGIVSTRAGDTDGFLATINTATNIYATLVGGNGVDTIKGLSIDPLGSPYYIASTNSANLLTYPKSASTELAGMHGYVAKHAFGVVEVTAPIGGETYCVGISKPISWSALGFADTSRFQIQYSAYGSNVWNDVAKNVSGRSYLWKVPALPTGQYVVRVTTIQGHLSELLTPFTISSPPSIVKQPVDVSACGGKSATLSITAGGAGLKYQWRKAGVNVPGATNATYTIAAVDASSVGKYDCLISGTCTPSVTSALASVSFGTPTEITRQPAGMTVDEGKPFTLSVAATGSTLSYQWSKSGVEIAGATTAEYTVSAATKANEGQYTCAVTGGCGTVTSSAATVVVMGGTSVDEELSGSSILRVVGPVPADADVTVRFSLDAIPSAAARLSIVDLNGNRLAAQAVQSSTGSFDARLATNMLAAGMYFIEYTDGAIAARSRLVIAR
ncbi:MAG: hypothetical protein FGM33_01590 [Candidatus Kapabacteria bacterium]|nr:hypothetical protein [Candidatus Kapabacteria bacterium]